MIPGRRSERVSRDRGAAMVEFAIVFPLLFVLLMGTISGGVILNRQLSLTHSAREAARYGATVPVDQCTGASNPCGGQTWAQFVRGLAVERSNGELTAANVCVALLEDSETVLSSTNGGQRCYTDEIETGARVQVSVQRTDQSINAGLFRIGQFTLTSTATARHEG